MHTQQFSEDWDFLSDIQKKAVEWDKGHLFLLAGPGSGKTQVLTCRIARILNATRDENFRILGLTFTNKAADEMRTRVAKLVSGQETRLFLGTFHSFCADVLRQHGTHLGINPNFHIYSQNRDLQAILSDVLKEVKKKSSTVSGFDKKVLPVIQRLKSCLILPENCSGVFKDKQFDEHIAIIYAAYEAELARHNALDFNSLILKTYQLFSKFPAFAKRYRTVYPYICIDEFQDTNYAQYQLIRALTGDQHTRLFIVADDDQIIYQWNGASHKRIEEFINDYSPAVMQLPVNYRCPSQVVELANNLIRHNFLRASFKQPLEAFHESQENDVVRLFPPFEDFDAEAKGIAEDMKRFHADHLDTVVVLGRTRRLLNTIEAALKNAGISAVIAQRKDEFESTPFVWLNALLRLANDRQNHDHLEAVCGAFAQLTSIEIAPGDVMIQAKTSNRDYVQHWLKLVQQEPINGFISGIIEQTASCLGEGRDFYRFSQSALDWFQQLVEARQKTNTDPTREVFARYEEERAVWQELMRDITGSSGHNITLEAFLQELQMRSKEPSPKPATVTLMTIHGAKGKEFEHVYLAGLVEDELPSFQSKQKGDKSPEMEEERRNCFVAITRTSKSLTLSYAKQYNGWKKTPSRFLYEMGLLNRNKHT
jgi:DNA helicase II / ATP-dependent DNA helicase PcrA